MKKILIIKLGYSETLVHETKDRILSLGDVLRTTVLLNLYKNDRVTWITNKEAFPLLKGNPLIHRLMDIHECSAIVNEDFDIIINLEKSQDAAIFADTVKGRIRYGFTFNELTGEVLPYDDRAQHALDICHNKKNKIFLNHQYWEEILFEIVGATWKGEMPQIAYKLTSRDTFDIGFNHKVGKKWPTKAWPEEYWKHLNHMCHLLDCNYTVSWQQGSESIEEYISWINSCRLIVTNDSLGLHIAHALDKKIVALFGPTLASEVYIKDGVKILPDIDPPCQSCLDTVCVRGRSCMYNIDPLTVLWAIRRLLKKDSNG